MRQGAGASLRRRGAPRSRARVSAEERSPDGPGPMTSHRWPGQIHRRGRGVGRGALRIRLRLMVRDQDLAEKVARLLVLRMGEELFRRRLLDDAALGHEDDT